MSFLDNAGLAYLWGKIKSYIAGTAFSMNPGTSIPENSNLNSYTTLGTYYSVNSANTATIVNSPLTGSGFVLYVMRHAEGGNIYQFVIGNSTQLPIYSRIYVTNTGTWYGWNKLARGIDVISDSAPADTATAAQCLAYAQARPNVMFTWAKWSPATYTPVQTSASWVYTLYTTYTGASQYTVFEAQNNTSGDLYRCKADGTWVKLAIEPVRVTSNLSAAVAVANNTWTSITNITLSPGTWLVNGEVNFPANATGLRRAILAGASGTGGSTRYWDDIQPGMSNAATTCRFTGLITISSQTTYYLRVLQTSGASMNVSQYSGVDAIKLI